MATTQLGLPTYLRNSLLFAIVVLIVMSWVQTPLLKMVAAVSGVTMGISILMTLLISLENIYKGDSRVTPEPIERILPSIGP
jgi:ABC-type transport system involved in cytochrome c biogenesis permease component